MKYLQLNNLISLEEFTCRIYSVSSKSKFVNTLRHEMFLSKRGEVDSSTLPPCQNSLLHHIKRANYQAGIWQRSLEAMPDIPDANENGWIKSEHGSLHPHWISGKVAPDAVLELLSCKCKYRCEEHNCLCVRNELKCTDICHLHNCSNPMRKQS